MIVERPPSPDAASEGSTVEPTPPHPRRVLVVDDNVDAAETLALLLGPVGHVTAVANTGESALDLTAQFRPDVLLLDIGLPVMSGHEVAATLRARGEQQLFIVALTGWGQVNDRRKSAEAGIDVHLVKPVDPGRLLELVARGAADPERLP